MRLIHVLCEDDVRVAFLERFNVMTRAQLDARSGPQRVGTVFDLAAERMNDLVFHPVSVVNPDLHDSFSKPRDLGRDTCMNGTIMLGGQCKDKVADMKVKLYKIMDKYELSGNGEGDLMNEDEEWVTRDATDPNFGSWCPTMYKDDNRKDFLGNFGEEILYAWLLFDQNEIRQSVLATLYNKQAATVDGVPATDEPASHRKRKKDRDSIDESELIESLDRMTRNTGLADITRAQTDMTRAQTSGLAELICAQEKQDDAMTKYSLLSYDTTNPQKKALYESMDVKAKN